MRRLTIVSELLEREKRGLFGCGSVDLAWLYGRGVDERRCIRACREKWGYSG